MTNSITTCPSLWDCQALLCVCMCVWEFVWKMAWLTRKWWTRSDTWPLMQPRTHGLNRNKPLGGCGWITRTSTIYPSGLADLRCPAAGASKCGLTLKKQQPSAGFLLQLQIYIFLEIAPDLSSSNVSCTRKYIFSCKVSYGGLSRWWFSGEGSLPDAVTVYTAQSLVKVQRKIGAWRLSLEYSDSLPYRRLWKGSNRNKKVKVAVMDISRGYINTCYPTFKFFKGVNIYRGESANWNVNDEV